MKNGMINLLLKRKSIFFLISLHDYNFYGPVVIAFQCEDHPSQIWSWNTTDGTVRSNSSDKCLTVPMELEVWSGPLTGGSQAVVLLNRADSGSEEMTVKWIDIGFPSNRSAKVRDLWAHRDLGIFTNNYTSPKIDSHTVIMLNITLVP